MLITYWFRDYWSISLICYKYRFVSGDSGDERATSVNKIFDYYYFIEITVR